MATENDLKSLEQSAVLRRLTPEDRALVGDAMSGRDFAAASVIWRLGEPAASLDRGLYLVISGEVSVAYHGRTGASTVNRTLSAGSVFGESTLMHEGPSLVGARALTPTRMMFLSRDRFAALAATLPALKTVLEDLHTLRALESDVFAAMRRSALARHFSPRTLAEMCEVAEILRADPDEVILRQGEGSPGYFFVISGELKVTVRHEGSDRPPVLVDTLHPGDVFGDVALVTGSPQPSTVAAWGPVQLARVRVENYRKMLELSQTYRRGVRNPAAPEAVDPLGPVDQSALVALADRPRQGETRLLVSSVRAPTGVVASLLAQTLSHDHEDHVLVVSFPRPGSVPQGGSTAPTVMGSVARVELHVDDDGAGQRLGELLDRVGTRFDYVLVDAADRGDAFLSRIEHRIDRVVHLTTDTYAPLPTRALAQCPVLHAVLLGAPRPRHEVTTNPSMHSGTVRLRLDLETLGRRRDMHPTELPPHERASFSRLARAVSNRRVGIALGGGGSWGYAHLTLLLAMKSAGVPVDLVAGCSFGSLVGAYWCALGEEGARILMRRGEALRSAVMASFVTSTFVSRLVDHDLGGRTLEDLEVPFFPVATDVAMGAQRAIKSGRIGYGVRASGAFPGIFSPVTSRGYRLVDGGIINNVPEDVLVSEGADMVVASNVVSSPSPIPVPTPLIKRGGGRLLHEMNPLDRTRDLVRSMLILMHSAGSRDAHLADVTFNAEPVQFMPWDFSHAAEIARRAEPEVARVMADIRVAWEHLARPAAHREALDVAHLEAP